MRIITIDLQNPSFMKIPVAGCIGYFDGLHKGHQALLLETKKQAKLHGCESALITFDPDPWVTIKGVSDDRLSHITTLIQKRKLAIDYGIDNVIILHFTKEMCELSPIEFERRVLKACNLKALVCGFDFQYGYKGEGNAKSLQASKESNFDVVVVNPIEDEKGKISSSRIVLLLNNGKIEEANALLGHPFEMVGEVVHGKRVGRHFGFPTANLRFPKEYVQLKPGVYAVFAIVKGKKYKAMLNIGHNPTMNYSKELSYEVNIIGFDEMIYHTKIAIQVMKYLRAEKKFQNTDNLIMQLEQDRFTVERLLKL